MSPVVMEKMSKWATGLGLSAIASLYFQIRYYFFSAIDTEFLNWSVVVDLNLTMAIVASSSESF